MMNTTIIVVAGMVICALVGLAMWAARQEDKAIERIKKRLKELEEKQAK
jgi:prefoldin subunit 5